MREFRINSFLSLKLEFDETIIYVNGKRFDQCKFLLVNIPVESVSTFDEIDSIDEIGEGLDNILEAGEESEIQIPPEVEFWAHCSNLQIWYEHDYDSRLLHRNLAFPLLKRLSDVGDLIAKRVFREEIAKRLNSGFPAVVNYLIEEKYIDYLNREELLYNLLVHEEAQVVRELENISEIKFEILYDFEEYKRNSIVIREKKVVRLDMYKIPFRQFPEIITQLRFLRHLFLRKMELKVISEDIGKIESLEWLDFSYNKIERLPESIGSLQNLKELNLEKNELDKLPRSIGNLMVLQRLILNDNNLSVLPETFSNLDSLKSLWLINNNFKKILEILGNLRSLKRLVLTSGKFDTIPLSIRNNHHLSVTFSN